MHFESCLTSEDGLKIWYGMTGPEKASPLILCDGIGCDGFIWSYLIDRFSETNRILRWHYRGHGHSESPSDHAALSLRHLVRDLRGIQKAAALGPSVIIGHSMGVQVALEYYRHYPEAVSHLILMCGSYGEPLKTFHGTDKWESFLPVVRSAVDWAPRFTRKLISRVLPTHLSFRIAKLAEVHPRRVTREDFFPYLEHASQLNPELFLDMLAHAGGHSAKDLLSEISVPTLVIAGGRDGFTPSSLSQEMFELIDDAELLLLPEGTHAAPIEFPQEINQRIEVFLGRRNVSEEGDEKTPVAL